MAFNGNNILVYRNGTAIAGSKSSELITSAGKIEISSATESMWREFIADRKEWSISLNYLVVGESGITDVLKAGNTYTIKIADRNEDYILQGYALCTICKQTYTRGSLVQGSFQFQGTGELEAL